MKPPLWLAEFRRQWHETRGHRLSPSARAFSRPWEDLLDATGLRSSFERDHARAEARALEKEGHLTLQRHRVRREDTLTLPLVSEPWLLALFASSPASELRDAALTIVRQAKSTGHQRWPESWSRLCGEILAAFSAGKSLAPFSWKEPSDLSQFLAILHRLTARDWPPHTLLRDASTALGLDSKALEQRRAPLESALSLLFAEPSSLESLGILRAESKATVQGILTLHFSDGTDHRAQSLEDSFDLSIVDLRRATHATTTARRILSVENKTTFTQAVRVNTDRDTLLILTSYPTAATARLLALLPPDLLHYHFGDTDPSGYAILASLRKISPRPIQPFLMIWQDWENSSPLSEHDRKLLPSLLANAQMHDCLPSLRAIVRASRKGRFEQESIGAPSLKEWPFWPYAQTVHHSLETRPSEFSSLEQPPHG